MKTIRLGDGREVQAPDWAPTREEFIGSWCRLNPTHTEDFAGKVFDATYDPPEVFEAVERSLV